MDKALLVNIALLIHMALTGIMLFRLFKLKNVQGGELILTFLGLMIPIIGPSALITYYTKKLNKQSKQPVQQRVTRTTKKKK